jgi:hypothetical protein
LNLAAERIVILPVGGATNTGKFLDALGPARAKSAAAD